MNESKREPKFRRLSQDPRPMLGPDGRVVGCTVRMQVSEDGVIWTTAPCDLIQSSPDGVTWYWGANRS